MPRRGIIGVVKKVETVVKVKTEEPTFNSPTHGKMGWLAMLDSITAFMAQDKKASYRAIVGSDSDGHQNRPSVDFITAIILQRVGRGAVYFWKKYTECHPFALKQRMYTEAFLSLEMAQALVKDIEKLGIPRENLEIHVDVGAAGETRDLIAEITGMIRGNGFNVKTKPESFGASCVADKHT